MIHILKLPLLTVLVALILLFSAAGGNACGVKESRTDIAKDTTNQLRDGMYLVISEIKSGYNSPLIIGSTQIIVNCSSMLIENNDNEYTKLVVDTSDYVPLRLSIKPRTEQQTETKKKIEIELTKSSADKLEKFTTVNLNKRIALIIGGEVISAHKIKTPITGGKFQISYCGPDMCEILESRLINNVDSTEVK